METPYLYNLTVPKRFYGKSFFVLQNLYCSKLIVQESKRGYSTKKALLCYLISQKLLFRNAVYDANFTKRKI
jgi:hypothetical protein